MVLFENSTTMIRADHVPGPGQGNWTYQDYAALDDGKRYEILDGVLYMTPAPGESHQNVAGNISFYFKLYVQFAGQGMVYSGPFDVELAPSYVVQPDVLVVLRENLHKLRHSHLIGAPDLTVEIASPSTVKIDRQAKKDAYARAGVLEYWIVDPIAQTIKIFALEKGTYRQLGIFSEQDTLPSKIVPEMKQIRVEQLFASLVL